jgi:hypothetical protein
VYTHVYVRKAYVVPLCHEPVNQKNEIEEIKILSAPAAVIQG